MDWSDCRSRACATSQRATMLIDASGKILFPGFVNNPHYHFYQTLTRVIPGAELWSCSTG